MNEQFLDGIFRLLSNNINFPYYQAERRIDIFINFFLEDIIRQSTKFKNARFIAAEFPLVKSESSAHAAHIDYLMVDEESQTVLMIELKTDNGSYDQSQILFYLKHNTFENWRISFDGLKMKGFLDKKGHLNKELNKITGDLNKMKVEVIVLKPTVNSDQDLNQINDPEIRNKIHFVALKTVEISTNYRDEWNSLKNNILVKLRD